MASAGRPSSARAWRRRASRRRPRGGLVGAVGDHPDRAHPFRGDQPAADRLDRHPGADAQRDVGSGPAGVRSQCRRGGGRRPGTRGTGSRGRCAPGGAPGRGARQPADRARLGAVRVHHVEVAAAQQRGQPGQRAQVAAGRDGRAQRRLHDDLQAGRFGLGRQLAAAGDDRHGVPAGSMTRAPRSACWPAPPSSLVITVAIRSGRPSLIRPAPQAAAGRPGDPDRLQAAVHVQLGEDVPRVGTHRIGGNEQVLGDLPASFAVHHGQQHVPLPRAEHVQQVVVLAGPAHVGAQLAQDRAEHVRREPGVALAHPADHSLQLGGALLLGHPGGHPGPGRLDRVPDVVVRAEHDHLGLRAGRDQPLQDLARGWAERLHLDRDDVRAQPAHDVQQVGVGGGAPAGHPQVHGGG